MDLFSLSVLSFGALRRALLQLRVSPGYRLTRFCSQSTIQLGDGAFDFFPWRVPDKETSQE
jgi:hypothetical protein